ncbi:MAG: family HAD-type hydrolase [Paenibacillus sp.]|nr:family HAD-type hydrolase [Paenibacillus sp.]
MRKKAFLIDLDGTIIAGSRLIPGADAFIRALEQNGFPYLYVTNNASRTPEAVADHLQSVGIPIYRQSGKGRQGVHDRRRRASAGVDSCGVSMTGVANRSNLESQLQSAGAAPSLIVDNLPDLLYKLEE